jgi:type I restriction enzyme S subunit
MSLPQGWCLASISDTGKYINGFAFKPQHWGDTGRPIIRIQNLTKTEREINRTDFIPGDEFVVRPGDILVSWSATLDAFIWEREEALVNQHIFRVIPETRLVTKKYLFYLLKQAIQEMQKTEHLHGSTMKHINRGPFMAYEVPIAPRAEQDRVVDEIEKQYTRLDAAVTALKRVQTNLKRYRASVLKAACEGGLVPTEAELARKEGRSYEPASELLKRILADRRAKWESDQLQKMIAAGKPPRNDEWRSGYKDAGTPILPKLSEVAEGWSLTNLGQLKHFSIYGPRFSSEEYASAGTPVLRTTDISESGRVNMESAPRLPLSVKEIDRFKLLPFDLVFTRTGATIGKVALFNDVVTAIPGAYLIHYRLCGPPALARYVYRYFQSPKGQQALVGGTLGIGQPNLNAPTIESIPIPLPPEQEQFRILAELEKQLEEIERRRVAMPTTLMRSTALRQRILASAFSGKLVPQDPTDEPASVLLERIRTERAALATNNGNRKAITKAGTANGQRRRRVERLAHRVSGGKGEEK